MKLAVMSDFHVETNLKKFGGNIRNFLKTNIINQENNNIDIFIIPGDISEDEDTIISTLTELKNLLPNTVILYTYGNHELWDYKTYQMKRFIDINYNASKNKIARLKRKIKKLNNKDIYLLDGNIFKYKGIKILGIPMWYDFSYGYQLGYDKDYLLKLWNKFMYDSKMIFWQTNKNFLNFNSLEFYNYQYRKLKRILKKEKNVDIVFSHIGPIAPENMNSMFKNEPASAFYFFDGKKILEQYNHIKYWFFGHTHEHYEIDYNNTKIICNAYGYPHEKHNKLLIIEI